MYLAYRHVRGAVQKAKLHDHIACSLEWGCVDAADQLCLLDQFHPADSSLSNLQHCDSMLGFAERHQNIYTMAFGYSVKAHLCRAG